MGFVRLPALFAAFSFIYSAAIADPANQLQVKLTSGTFVGVGNATEGTEKWLGVPFAQPPIGTLRFKAPVPITRPSRVVRQAVQFGNACPQSPSPGLGAPVGEDCLFLNVRFFGHRDLYRNTVFIRMLPSSI